MSIAAFRQNQHKDSCHITWEILSSVYKNLQPQVIENYSIDFTYTYLMISLYS